MPKHGLHENEKELCVYRKHEITLLPRLFEIFVVLFVPWFFGLKYDFAFSSPTWTKVYFVFSGVVLVYLLRYLLLWRMNIYLFTDKRLLYIYHPRIFKKIVTETPLDRILNVSFRTKGIISTIFHFGDVLVQVVGLDQPLVFKDIPEPEQVKDFIWKLHLEFGTKEIVYVPHAPVTEKNAQS